jgi:D-alanine-D-alanine ligase
MSTTEGAASEPGERLRVAILFGGRSAEHEISILSARFVVSSIDRARFEPVLVGIDPDGRWSLQDEAELLAQSRDPRAVAMPRGRPSVVLRPHPTGVGSGGSPRAELVVDDGRTIAIDAVFPVLHGPLGEDGSLQGLLTLTDVAFVGSGVLGSSVGMDKDTMKRLLREAGLPIVAHRVVRASRWARDRAEVTGELVALGAGGPVFVKPANLGSSVGVSKAKDSASVARAMDEAFRFDEKVVVEAGVPGVRELECAVLGDPARLDAGAPRASCIGEIVVTHPDGFYSYTAKYVDSEGSTTVLPAELAEAESDQLRALAIRTFEALECQGLARVDFFRGADGTLYVNEINTLPGFTAVSMYPKLWAHAGLGATELLSALIDLGIDRALRRARLATRA